MRTSTTRGFLNQASPQLFNAFCVAAAFGAYFCMYAFRKPFTAAEFSGEVLFGLGYKSVLIAAQVAGYTVSKVIGIKVISEMPSGRRAVAILVLIGIAEAALIGFALVPPPYNFVLLFINGLPLGMVFGLVLSFLEGRRCTEVLAAGLCASFIMSSGVVKSVGRWLVLDVGLSDYMMPAAVGVLFIPPLLLTVWMLSQIPPPTSEDIARRGERPAMTRKDRRAFWRKHWPVLTGLIAVYVVLTMLRSLRDDFAVEIWAELGQPESTGVFALCETVVMCLVILLCGATALLRSNTSALFTSLGLVLFGFCLVLLATGWLTIGSLSPLLFMVLFGTGLYVPYVVYQTTLFERLLATMRGRANIGYVIYLADSLGYLGYVGLMLVKPWIANQAGFLPVLTNGAIYGSVASGALTLAVMCYCKKHAEPTEQGSSQLAEANR